jgi:ADP-heptose:LPS heptosyltransferase
LLLVDWFCLFIPHQTEKGLKKKILFIRFDAIGDFILWLDAAKELKQLYPQSTYEITLLGNQIWTPIAEKLPYFDSVLSLDRHKFLKNPFYRLKVLKNIRQTGFNMVIQPTFSREFLFGDAIVRASGAENRIGSEGDFSNIMPWQKRISDRWYTRLIPAAKEPLIELKRNAEFMQGLGLKTFQAGLPELEVTESLPKYFGLTDYYVLFPGAGTPNRRWPMSNFEELANRIYHQTKWTGVICGGQDEKKLGETLVNKLDVPVQNWAGKTTVDELIAIIARAHFVIGNETSGVHIATAISTPAVCILGGGHYGRFMPYQLEVKTEKPLPVAVNHKMDCFNCNWHCIYNVPPSKAAPCVANISVDMVWKEIENILEKEIVRVHGEK